ncbi:MAG: hypothetical protein HY776_04995 [Actinobacteria bacterium]|nr:hypothetical protein [Actinomycetota bacterium]
MKQKTKNIFKTILYLAIIVIISTIVLSPTLFQKGIASGADTGSYLLTTKFIADSLKNNLKLPQINPYWYAGFEITHNAPPLTYFFLIPLYLIFKDIALVSRIFHLLIISLTGFSMFFVMRKTQPLINSFAGSILFSLAPIVLFQTTGSGSYPRSLAIVFIPISFYYVNQILEKNQKYKNLSLLALFLSLGLLSHPMVGITTLIFIGIYTVARVTIDNTIKSTNIFYWLSASVFSFLLTAWYLIPYFIEQTAWSTVPEEVYIISSVKMTEYLFWLGPILIFFSVWTIIKKKASLNSALFIAGIISMIFALGFFSPLDKIIRFQAVYPFIALLFAAFSLSYLASISFDFQTKNNLFALSIFLIAITYTSFKGYQQTKDQIKPTNSKSDIEISRIINKLPDKGRIMPMKYPFNYLLWWMGLEGKRPMIEGWYYSLTPIGKHIAWIYDAIDNGYPKYAARKLNRLNTNYLLTNKNFSGKNYTDFLNTMKQDSFLKIYSNKKYVLYEKNKKSSYVQVLKEKTLFIGKFSPQSSPLINNSVEGGPVYIDDYDLSFLKLFDVIVLTGFGFHNQQKAENLILDYIKNGGKAIVSLDGIEGNPLEENKSFFGVTEIPLTLNGSAQLLKTSDPLLNNFDLNYLNFSQKTSNWKTVSYFGLDKTILKLKPPFNSPLSKGGRGEVIPSLGKGEDRRVIPSLTKGGQRGVNIIGYKKIGGKKLYFVGANLFYYAFLNHNQQNINLINNLAKTVKPQNDFNSITLKENSIKPEQVKFSYNSKQNFPALVSFANSKHFKAYIDQKETKIYNLEDLILLVLPPGSHRVEIKYENTPIHFLSNSLSIVSLIFLGWLIQKEKRKILTKNEF